MWRILLSTACTLPNWQANWKTLDYFHKMNFDYYSLSMSRIYYCHHLSCIFSVRREVGDWTVSTFSVQSNNVFVEWLMTCGHSEMRGLIVASFLFGSRLFSWVVAQDIVLIKTLSLLLLAALSGASSLVTFLKDGKTVPEKLALAPFPTWR